MPFQACRDRGKPSVVDGQSPPAKVRAMPLSWNEIRHRAVQFRNRWADAASEAADKRYPSDGIHCSVRDADVVFGNPVTRQGVDSPTLGRAARPVHRKTTNRRCCLTWARIGNMTTRNVQPVFNRCERRSMNQDHGELAIRIKRHCRDWFKSKKNHLPQFLDGNIIC